MTDTTFEIDIRDVFYRYDAESNALDGISLRIPSGQFLCILGGNGSGKSTLAKHMNALLVPDEGSVHILGVDTRDPDNVFFVRSNAGMVFQNPDDQLVSSIIEDDVAFGPENLGLDPAVIRERMTEALQSVGLQGFEKRACASLSGGQKQRVAIAGVLAMDPQILILDEASAMLDPRGRHGLLKACKALNERGLTIVFITHFMDEAAEADRIIVLDNGKIALDGTPDEVLVQTAMLDALSLEVPFAVHMSTLLRDNDIEIGLHIDDDSLINCLAETLESTSRNTIIADHRIIPSSSASASENVGSSRDCTESLIRFEHVSFTYSEKRAKRGNKSTSDADAQTVEPAIWGNDPDSYWALHDISLNLR